jgi:hypothetical protein
VVEMNVAILRECMKELKEYCKNVESCDSCNEEVYKLCIVGVGYFLKLETAKEEMKSLEEFYMNENIEQMKKNKRNFTNYYKNHGIITHGIREIEVSEE